MTASIESFETRIASLEKGKQTRFQFFVQYLLSPLLVVLVGLMFNFQLEKEKKALQQIEIAQSMLSSLFSEDKFKTLATKRLMDEVIESDALKKEIGNIVQDYLNLKFNKSFEDGDLESAKNILDAAKTMGGDVGRQIDQAIPVEQRKVLSRYQQARQHELKGFSALAANRFGIALKEFQTARQIYPDLHSVAEIEKLLQSQKNALNSPEIQQKIKKEILTQYSWKAPTRQIESLKQQATEPTPIR